MLAVLQPEPLWDIVEEHLDEAEFLWELWEHSLVSPKYTMAEVEAGPKARLDAHIDALVAHGQEVAEMLLLPVLASETAEPTRVSAAATALLLSPGEAGVRAVLGALQTNVNQRAAIARALEACDRLDLLARIEPFLHALDLDVRDTAARVMVFKRRPLGEVLTTLLASDRSTARVPGLQALYYEPATAQQRRAVLQAFGAQEPEVRDAAWTAAAVLRMPQVWPELRARVLEPGCGHALLLLALRGAPEDHAFLIALLDRAELRSAALWALGFLGTPAAVEASLKFLEDPKLARLAGEVFSSLTGLDLDDEHMASAPDEENLFYNSELELPIPEPEPVLGWWIGRPLAYFKLDQRLVGGLPMDARSTSAKIESCNNRRRAVLELCLNLRSESRDVSGPASDTLSAAIRAPI